MTRKCDTTDCSPKADYKRCDSERRYYRKAYRRLWLGFGLIGGMLMYQTMERLQDATDIERLRTTLREQLEAKVNAQDASNEQIAKVWAANSFLLDSLVWERRQNGKIEAQSIINYQKLKKVNESWTCQVETQ